MKYSGPAFPVIGKHNSHGAMEIDSSGMTLRDYFAAQALIAVIPTPKTIEDFEVMHDSVDGFAEMAYQIADAMIKIREESNVSEKT